MEVVLSGNHFQLLPQRAIYWREKEALILSDLHFGKATHFRKGGIPIPATLFGDDLNTLDFAVKNLSPKHLIIVGDMFHSDHNGEVEQFGKWRDDKDKLDITLVKGNHDILGDNVYSKLNITVVKEDYVMDGFVFSHHPCDHHAQYCFSGHIHPGVRLVGNARQSLRFPCFHFTEGCCVMPAFSKFTGLSLINPTNGDKVYAIVEDKVIQL